MHWTSRLLTSGVTQIEFDDLNMSDTPPDTCNWVLERLTSVRDWYSFSDASLKSIRHLRTCLAEMVEDGRLETMTFNNRPYYRVMRTI